MKYIDQRERGITMVELLVVVGIIGVLSSVLLPALSVSRDQARSVQCVSNLKQLYLANAMFAAEHDGLYAPAAPDLDADGGGLVRWHGERPAPDQDFDANRGPLAEYLPDGRVKTCPVFFEYATRENSANAFESGTGGYGYNRSYLGGTEYDDWFPESLRHGTRDSNVRNPAETIMFADAAMAQNGHIIEYSFLEPPYFPTPDHPTGNESWGYSSPSIHFRHRGRANVLWADGHITSEKWEWAPDKNAYGASSRRWSIGWFGPKNNYYFDAGEKAAYGAVAESQ
jgi:prepilin-type processing-associated H-X9-DG protein